MLFTVSGSLAEATAENAAAPKIAGRIEDGAYVLTVLVGPEETGEWRVDEMAQDDSRKGFGKAQRRQEHTRQDFGDGNAGAEP